MQQPSPELLAVCPLFGGLSSECCAAFAQRLVRVELVAGQTVYDEGDPAHELYIVAEGRLEVFKTTLSPDLALTDLHPGDFFGDMSFIDMQPRSATIRAALPSAIWRLDYAVLRETYQLDMKCYTLVVMNIAREMSRRLRRADRGRKPSQGPR
jgi:CRP-like cAMP-binding protein